MSKSSPLSAQEIGQMKAKYEVGKAIRDIANNLGVSPSTVTNHAKKGGWKHGINKAVIAQKVELETQNVIFAKNVERSTQETEKFLSDSERIRALTLSVIAKILKDRDPATNDLHLNMEDGELYFQYLKIGKIAMETLNIQYMGKRKALRMDDQKEADLTVLPWAD